MTHLPSVARWCFLALGAVIPLWFFPTTIFPVLYNKIFLISLITIAGVLAWLGTAMQKGSFVLARLPWSAVFYGGFLATMTISAIFAAAPATAIRGIGGEAGTLFVWLLGGIILMGIPFVFEKKQDLLYAWMIVVASYAIITLFFIVHTILDYQFLPWDFTRVRTFTPIGSWSNLGIFFGFIAALTLPFLSFRIAPRIRFISMAVFAVAFIGMAIVNFFWTWIALGLVAITFLALLLSHLRERALIAAPLAVLLLVVFGVLAQQPLSFYLSSIGSELELTPDFPATLQVIQLIMKESPFFGAGPNHFDLAWDQFKPAAINESPFWGVRLSSGMSTVGTVLAEGGAFGGVTLVLFIVFFFWHAFKQVGNGAPRRPSVDDTSALSGAISALLLRSTFAGSLFLFLLWFLAPLNSTLLLLSFFIAGLYLAVESHVLSTQKTIQLFQDSRKGFLISLAMILLMVGATSVVYFEVSRYFSHLFFTRGMQLYNEEGSVNGAEQAIMRAVNFDKRQAYYWRALTELSQVKMERALAADVDPAEASNRFQEALSSAIRYAQNAVAINPEDGLNWVALGRVYEAATPFVEGAGKVALAHYTEARKRLPIDPSLAVAESRVHLGLASIAQRKQEDPSGEVAKAKEALEHALALKSNYALAHFQLAQLYAQEGNLKEAIARAEEARVLSPGDIGVLFQLGLLYYQKNDFDRAKEVFKEAVALNPDYANTLYFLGLIYDQEGETDAAIEQFERIVVLNPENKEAQQILRNLKAGQPALSDVPGPRPEKRDKPPVPEEKGKSELEE